MSVPSPPAGLGLLPFPASMYPDQVTIKNPSFASSAAGGSNPLPGSGVSVFCSVQPRQGIVEARDKGLSAIQGSLQESIKILDVYFQTDPGIDLRWEMDWLGKVYSAIGPAQSRGGYGYNWWAVFELIS